MKAHLRRGMCSLYGRNSLQRVGETSAAGASFMRSGAVSSCAWLRQQAQCGGERVGHRSRGVPRHAARYAPSCIGSGSARRVRYDFSSSSRGRALMLSAVDCTSHTAASAITLWPGASKGCGGAEGISQCNHGAQRGGLYPPQQYHLPAPSQKQAAAHHFCGCAQAARGGSVSRTQIIGVEAIIQDKAVTTGCSLGRALARATTVDERLAHGL